MSRIHVAAVAIALTLLVAVIAAALLAQLPNGVQP